MKDQFGYDTHVPRKIYEPAWLDNPIVLAIAIDIAVVALVGWLLWTIVQ